MKPWQVIIVIWFAVGIILIANHFNKKRLGK